MTAVYSGEVVSRYVANYGFRVSGMVRARPVEVGQAVRAGGVLAVLDPGDLRIARNGAAAQADAAAAQASSQVAELRRDRRLVDEGFISPSEFDRDQAGARSAEAQLRSARARLQEAEQQQSYTTLRAQRSGTVVSTSVNPGEVVEAGRPIVALADPSHREVAVAVPEGELATFRGSLLTVSFWSRPDLSFPAHLRSLASAASPQTRTFDGRVTFFAPDSIAPLGSTATVTAHRADEAAGLQVPLTAVSRYHGRPVVWAIEGRPTRVRPRPITLQGAQENTVVVRGSIRPGLRIVSAGAQLLVPGELVRVVTSSREDDR